jgi:hypothetical protein
MGEEKASLWPEESASAGTSVTFQDHVETTQWLRPNVFDKECLMVCSLL